MAVDKELLEILCCPKTKVPVKLLTDEQITAVNETLKKKEVRYVDGKPVEKPLQEGLITTDGKTIYRVDDDIPIMLIDMGISTDQLDHFNP